MSLTIAYNNQLRKLRCLSNMTYTRAEINRPKDTILLKKSEYSRRSYFAYIKLTAQETDVMKRFIRAGVFKNEAEYIAEIKKQRDAERG